MLKKKIILEIVQKYIYRHTPEVWYVGWVRYLGDKIYTFIPIKKITPIKNTCLGVFFFLSGFEPGPYIFYTLFIPIELSLRGLFIICLS